MEHDFWHRKWERNEIGFHQANANSMLVRHFDELALTKGARVFLPLCGKTLDIGWLLSCDYRVIGSELSEIAIQQLFETLGEVPEVSDLGGLKRYRANRIDIFVGDFFNLTREMIGDVDAVYDRAALVALPKDMRPGYAAHLADLTEPAAQFLISFEYDESLLKGPPFSIEVAEVGQIYADRYDLTQIDRADVKGGLKGVCPADEIVWILRPRRME